MDKADIAGELIDERIEQALAARRAAAERATLVFDEFTECEDCGGEIPAARRERLPGVRTCVPCQTAREARR